jgi:ribonuclease HII
MTDFISVQIIEDLKEDSLKDLKKEKMIIKKDLKKEKMIIKKDLKKEKMIIKKDLKKEKMIIKKDLKKESVIPECLLKRYHLPDTLEIGADEVGRGPMLGRVYSGAVILPKDDTFDHYKMKDSKKFTSKNPKKIQEIAEYIKEHAIAWAVEYEDEGVIDAINILQATQSAMHKAIKNVIKQLQEKEPSLNNNYDNLLLLIDGNYFKHLTILNNTKTRLISVNYETIISGDNTYTSIAAASILAKVERDKYIDELCKENPELIERYGIDSNKGYGSKQHMDGIKKYGITKWHRRTFGICSTFESTFGKVEQNKQL